MTDERDRAPELVEAEVVETPPPPGGELVPVDGAVFHRTGQLVTLSQKIVEAELAPRGMNAAAVFSAIVMGRGFGLNEMVSMQSICSIHGQLSWRGKAAVALIRNSDKCVPGSLFYGYEGENDELVGWAVAHRVGYRQPQRMEFSLKKAKQIGLYPGKEGSSWRKEPDRMCMWRAVGRLANDLFSDVLGGFPMAEEAQDFDPTARPTQLTPGVATQRPAITPPAAPDPLMAALAGEHEVGDVVAAEALPEPEDECEHGVVLSKDCDACIEADDKAAALEAEKAEGGE